MTYRHSGASQIVNRRRDDQGHLTDPVDRRLARLIARSLGTPWGRHSFSVLFGEFMQRGYEARRQLPKADRR